MMLDTIKPRFAADFNSSHNLCCKELSVDEVMVVVSGKILKSRHVIGNKARRAMKLRIRVKSKINSKPLFICPVCKVPLSLRTMKNGQFLYFAHIMDPHNCPRNADKTEKRSEILAAKYNGAKESDAHKNMKTLVKKSLEQDSSFSDTWEETSWKDETLGKIRRPDIQTRFKEKERIAIEVQISTTFLDVIVGRVEHYKRTCGFLLWIFKEFGRMTARMMEHDVFNINNCNAFVVDRETLKISTERGRFHLRCIWAEPVIDGDKIIHIDREEIIPFEQIHRNKAKQEAYYFDYDGNYARVHEELKDRLARKAQEEALERMAKAKAEAIAGIHREWNREMDKTEGSNLLSAIFEGLPSRIGPLTPVEYVNLLMSAKTGVPYGWHFDSNLQLFKQVYSYTQKSVFFILCCALSAYGNMVEDNPDKKMPEEKTVEWKKKEAWKSLTTLGKGSQFFPAREGEEIMRVLFPQAYKKYMEICRKYHILEE